MIGNHQVQAAVTYASAFDFLNYQVLYSYLRFRPQFFFGAVGDTRNSVFVTSRESRREDSQFGGVAYPLDRFDSVQLQVQTTDRRSMYSDDSFVTLRESGRETASVLSFKRDVSQGRYLETTSGYRVEASYEDSNRYLGSSSDYRNAFAQVTHFQPFHKESTLAARLFGGAGFGGNTQFFRAGGEDMLRGFSRYDTGSSASRFVISNLEYRFPIVFDLNYHIWFFFPDFLFKNVYGSVFTDNGILWDRRDELLSQGLGDIKNSVGVGIRFEAFVLQTFPVALRVDWARRTKDGEQVFYFGLGPSF
jgi:outer membrane protein insertion porin family